MLVSPENIYLFILRSTMTPLSVSILYYLQSTYNNLEPFRTLEVRASLIPIRIRLLDTSGAGEIGGEN